MLGFRLAVESDFTAATNQWQVAIPSAALVGDYLLAMLASPAAGVIWTAPGWQQIEGYSTVQFSLGGFAQSPVAIPISYGIFSHFLTPFDLNPSGLGTVIFSCGSGPTSVVGSSPSQAAGVALCAAYTGANKARPVRWSALAAVPPLSIAYNPLPTFTVPPFTPVSAVSVPAIFADQNDWLVCPLIAPGSGSNISLPGASFIFRASTTGGQGITIALVDENVNQGGLQSGLQWGASSLPTPLVTEAITLWPDDGPYMPQEIRFYATLDRNPVHFDYDYSQEPIIIAGSVGYLIRVFPAPREAMQSLFSSAQFSGITLLVTRSDGSTFTQSLTVSTDGFSAYCATTLPWFPYTGRYTFQLQLSWSNGAVEFSSQAYLIIQPQGGQ